MFCEECGKKLEDHNFNSQASNLTPESLCQDCGRPLAGHRVTCGHCGRGFCASHAHPFHHTCTQSVKPIPGTREELHPGTGTSLYGTLVILGGIGVFIFGLFLVVGNKSGVFPTFPFAGFITTTLGLVMVAYGVQGKF
jgi:hypothetical protein